MRQIYLLIFFFVIVLLSGCRKELCYNHPHEGSVTVNIDWRHLPNDARYPAGIRVGFIQQPNQVFSQTFNFPSEGGSRTVAQGDYKVLVVNNDPDAVLFRGMNLWETAEAFSPSKRQNPYKAAPSNVDNPVPALPRIGITPPDLLMCSNDQSIFVTDNLQSKYTITATPLCYVKTVTVKIPVTGMKNLSEARGFLTGVSPSVYLGNGTLNQSDAMTLFEYGAAENATQLRAQFNIFGMVDKPDESYKLGLELLLIDQSVLYYEFDVRVQITDELKANGGTIVLERAIEIPDVTPVNPGGGGFNPGIGDWEDEDIEIII